jgi:glycogen operon protein
VGRDDLSFDKRDSAAYTPKCRVVDPAFTWGHDRAPATPWETTVIYEAHVRGFTMRHPAVPERLRGTYAGLRRKEVTDYIRSLGVTAVELLPVHAFLDDKHLLERGLRNYWGYNTIGFFAPEPRYSASGTVSEFKEMVAHFHDAGLEVILDVVYNHTAEGNEMGPTLSFKGIDNASYYRLTPEQPRYYINDTGTGNTLNLSHPRVLEMVTDSLRYWATEMRVDGFRFDLATILGRESYGFDEGGGFLDSCRQDPVLSRVKLIAEPWDCGPGGYQVGRFPPGWAEWNDRYRDTVRAYWKGDQGKLGELASRFTASADLFNERGRRPWASVNFITAHDGFTLNDLVSYNDKHNEANGEENRDGSSNNLSWNCGAEGPTDDSEIRSLRERQKRNLLATLLLSQGTPMLLAGDEFGRSQGGNNNAYCQNTDINWLQWEQVGDEGQALIAFVRRLLRLRRVYPVLRRGRFFTGQYNAELDVNDIRWINPSGDDQTEEQWRDPHAHCLGVLLDGRAQPTGIRRRGQDVTLLVVLNAYYDAVNFRVPQVTGGTEWALELDTAELERNGEAIGRSGEQWLVGGRSLLLFALAPERRPKAARVEAEAGHEPVPAE